MLTAIVLVLVLAFAVSLELVPVPARCPALPRDRAAAARAESAIETMRQTMRAAGRAAREAARGIIPLAIVLERLDGRAAARTGAIELPPVPVLVPTAAAPIAFDARWSSIELPTAAWCVRGICEDYATRTARVEVLRGAAVPSTSTLPAAVTIDVPARVRGRVRAHVVSYLDRVRRFPSIVRDYGAAVACASLCSGTFLRAVMRPRAVLVRAAAVAIAIVTIGAAAVSLVSSSSGRPASAAVRAVTSNVSK